MRSSLHHNKTALGHLLKSCYRPFLHKITGVHSTNQLLQSPVPPLFSPAPLVSQFLSGPEYANLSPGPKSTGLRRLLLISITAGLCLSSDSGSSGKKKSLPLEHRAQEGTFLWAQKVTPLTSCRSTRMFRTNQELTTFDDLIQSHYRTVTLKLNNLFTYLLRNIVKKQSEQSQLCFYG